MQDHGRTHCPNIRITFLRTCLSYIAMAIVFSICPGMRAAPPDFKSATSQASVKYDKSSRTFRLDGGNISYVFGINERGELQTVYWGRRLLADDVLPPVHALPGHPFGMTTTPQEYSGWGGGLFTEPALKVTFADGNRDLVLHYVSYSIDNNSLAVVLRDIRRDLFVTLHYTVDQQTGIIGRSALIENRTTSPVTIEQAAAASWNLPHGNSYSLRYLAGRWGGETTLESRAIQPGSTVLESRRGVTGHQNNPWFAIAHDSSVAEESGNVWFGALAWSGDWRITVEQDIMQRVHVTGGFNPFDFAFPLAPGARLETPVFYGGFSSEGFGSASRLLHIFELTEILPHAPNPPLRKVLYNSWEATDMNVNEANQEALAEKAASIGVERFVMDDGWFGQRGIKPRAGLGDWYVNPEKFPHGLKPLIDKVHSLGMDFGLWVEPEMVNLKSDLYLTHPDWVISFPDRPRTLARDQLVLNLARPEVRDYVFGVVDKLLSENDISFIKWDYNRNWSEPGWPEQALDAQKTIYVQYIHNYYSILDELRRKHPNVEFETCSGGGGRVDLGVLHRVDQTWTSDNTDPFDRLTIQDGFSHAYTPGVMMAWVTDSPNWYNGRSTSLSYRFLSAMQGSLGIGNNLNKWSLEDFATAKSMIATYKTIRSIVQRGSLYRLISPQNGSNFSATEYANRDQDAAVFFFFMHSEQERYPAPRLYLRGLNPSEKYKLRAISGKASSDTPEIASGAYWMGHGLDLILHGDYDAASFELERQR